MNAPLRHHEIEALRFLASGLHRMGVIDTDSALAAFMVFNGLCKSGHVACIPGDGQVGGIGPEFSLTLAGVDALVEADMPAPCEVRR